MRVIWALCAYCLLLDTAIAAKGDNTPHQAESRVLFVNPGFAQESFWHDVDLYAQAAADSLACNSRSSMVNVTDFSPAKSSSKECSKTPRQILSF
ncbi:hypothetical protein JCM19240_4290 [Vibrio maritimus]|uniref:Uncharacterized protein n=1 Tax=Vibrio maritimus TaxID=990268 RepID=A0A090T433_9VIBR|nr:hypothetical protein JCM19240_4290 [Vibrio maritimus]